MAQKLLYRLAWYQKMSRNNLRHLALILLLSVSNSMAQITDTQSGTDFADSVATKMPALSKPTGFGAFDTPPSTSAYSAANAKGSLGSLGADAMQRCANYVPTGDPVKDQECAGVNYMANNCLQPNATQRQIISGSANAYAGSNNCKGSYGSGAGAFDLSNQDRSMITNFGTATASTAPQSCRTITKIVSPAVTETYSCTKSSVYTEVNCTQDYNPTFGYATQPFAIENGSEVPTWSARTFNYTVNLDGLPSGVMLNRYQADNYGQLWVNGQVVMQNTLGGMTDMRNGWVGYRSERSCSYDWDSGSEYCYDYQAGPYFFNADGSAAGFYDDNCNWGCRGSYPGTDITAYFKPGQNTVTMVCANANSIGPCGVSISMQALGITSSAWTNNCGPYEGATGAALGNPE